MTVEATPETHGFQAEVKQLLHLMVHSLYSDREIFLRELISNASDANDKLRFEAIARPQLLAESPDLNIEVLIDAKAGQIRVVDTGIGMSKEEIVEHLGTIAHSGTSRFLEQLDQQSKAASGLIGQFGVGFYSAFTVADEVEVLSRRADLPESAGVAWRSDGRGEFSVTTVARPQRGTEVRLKLKSDAGEFLNTHAIRSLIRKYSDHIGFPVSLTKIEDAESKSEVVNHAQALWTRPRAEISDQEYREFYRHISHDMADPLTWSHNRVEGKREYTSLLYVPSVAPFDLWNREAPKGVKLYVQRVFITDHATHFLPLYLRFVRGIVDSKDLPLNVSRELLQQDATIATMRSALTKRCLSLLEKLASSEPEKYREFWTQFGAVLKEGIAEDAGNRDKIAELLRFTSSKSTSDEPDRSLRQYLDQAAAGQDAVYYLVAESLSLARSSPHLETLKQRDIEVLFMTDKIDGWLLQYLTEYDGHPLRDVARGELDLDGGEDTESPAAADDDLTSRIKSVLGDRVDRVRVSSRLTESPACLVLGDDDLGVQMREMLKAAGHTMPDAVPSLEVNPDHPLIRRLANEALPESFERLAWIVLDQAALAEGRRLDDPNAYLRRVNELLLALGIDSGNDGDTVYPS